MSAPRSLLRTLPLFQEDSDWPSVGGWLVKDAGIESKGGCTEAIAADAEHAPVLFEDAKVGGVVALVVTVTEEVERLVKGLQMKGREVQEGECTHNRCSFSLSPSWQWQAPRCHHRC